MVVDVLANDSDADGDTLGVSGVGGPSHGSAEAVAGGVRYTPAPNFNGSDSLVYTVSDGNGGTATATLRVTVTAMPEAPSVALSRTQVSIDYGDPIPTVTATATDGDTPAKSLRFTASGLPAGITLVDNRNGTAKISGKANVPAGTYAATIRASDGARTGSSELVLTVRKESASLAWNGDHFEATSGASANVTLRSVLDQVDDGSNGDLRNARVQFLLYHGTEIGGTPDLLVSSVTPGSGGTASVTRSLGVGTWLVVSRVVRENSYFTAADAKPVVVTVGNPGVRRSVLAGGQVTDPSFQNAPVPVNASNRRGHFGIAGRIEGSTTHATALYTFRGADGLDYVVESEAGANTLAFAASNRATLSGNCKVTVVDPATVRRMSRRAARASAVDST